MAPMLHKYITSWSYNRTIRILEKRFGDIGNNNTEKFYFLLGLALNNYYYSKDINDTKGMNNWKLYLNQYNVTNIDTSFGSELVGGHAGDDIFSEISRDTGGANNLIRAYFMSSVKSVTYRKSDDISWGHTESNLSYTDASYYNRTINLHGTLPIISDTLVNEMYQYYISFIGKLVPDYGTKINVLDHTILNSIAQQFYELSDGLHEIVYFYDVFRVGSNMIDIRFDKKQRLDNISYLNLRNQYIPQLNAYNSLLKSFDDGTWENTYSNIDDFNNALSTSVVSLDTVFNPVYPVGDTYQSLQFQLNANNNIMISLSNQINIKMNSIVSQTTTPQGSNVNLSNIFTNPSNTKTIIDIGTLQDQYASTINAGQDLSNKINGIETNVARLFVTIDGSNFNINGISLGINAALSYNTLYNGNIDIPLIGQGNVNYEPTIRYTKNIKPNIQCGNIEFMKTVANLYKDTVFTDISNITLSNINYNSNDGTVVVDKILGFTQIDDSTCGYTWTESQYDPYTNEPVKRNTVNIQVPFTFDDSEYQNSRLIFSNDPAIMKYTSDVYPFGNLTGWIDLWKNDRRITLQNDICNYTLRIPQINMELSNIAGRSNIIYDFTNTTGWSNYSNTTTLHMEASRQRGNLYDAADYNIRGVNINTFIINNFSNKTYFQIYDSNQSWFNNNYNSLYVPTLTQTDSIIGNDISRYRRTYDGYYTYRLDVPTILNYFNNPYTTYYDATNIYTGSPRDLNPYVWGIVLNIIDDSDITNFVENNRREYYFKLQERNDTQTLLNDLKTQLNDLDTTANNMKNSITLDRTIQNFILNNLITIPRYLSDSGVYLTDADGACPRLRCDDSNVMSQLMEQYNTDSNNTNKIIKILNAYTVNEYQCDYKVETYKDNTREIANLQNQINTLTNSIATIQTNIQQKNNQITNLQTQKTNFFNTDEGIFLQDNYNSIYTQLYLKIGNMIKNHIMPLNFPPNTKLHDVLENNSYQWTVYIKTKYGDLVNNSINSSYDKQKLIGPLLQNNPLDYPYFDNPNYKLPLGLNADVEYNNLNSNYIDLKKNYFIYDDQINILQTEVASLNSTLIYTNNMISEYNSQKLVLGNNVSISNMSFDTSVDVRDCSYFYGTASNAGYFVSENQNPPTVQNNKSGSTGFYYITNTFNSFSNDIINKIQPLINEGAKQSSNMFNAILNQRSDTYKSLGALYTLSFSNAPSLNHSNILYMLQNNKRFFNSFFNYYPGNEYINNIKGIGITNSNTLHILVDLQIVNLNYPSGPNTLGNITSACLEYGIRVTSNYLDYTAYYIKNNTTYISKDDVLNFTKNMPYYNNIPIFLSNNIPVDIYLNFKKVNMTTSLYSGNCQNIAQLRNFSFNLSNLSNIYDALSSAGYNSNDIEMYQTDNTNQIIEFKLKSDENLPYNKRYFKIQVGYYRSFDASYLLNYDIYTQRDVCFSYRYKYFDSDPAQSIIPVIENPYDQQLISLFHNYFNNKNKLPNSNNYNSIIGQVYSIKKSINTNILQYTASVYYKDSTNKYIDTIIPNDIFFNNLRAFEVSFLPNSSNKLYITNIEEIPYFSDGQNINDFDKVSDLPSPDYYGNLYRTSCFPPVTQTVFNNSFLANIDFSQLNNNLKDIISPIIYNSNISYLTKDIQYMDINLGLIEYTSLDAFKNYLNLQLKLEIESYKINYDNYSYSFILKPSYKTYYTTDIYSRYFPTNLIIYPNYSNIFEFLSDDYYNQINDTRTYNEVSNYRILLNFTFNTNGLNSIQACDTNYTSIVNNKRIQTIRYISNLNQSLNISGTNYTNLNTYLRTNNFMSGSNISFEYTSPRNTNFGRFVTANSLISLYPRVDYNENSIISQSSDITTIRSVPQYTNKSVSYIATLYGKNNSINRLGFDYIIQYSVDGNNNNYAEVTVLFKLDYNVIQNYFTSYPIKRDPLFYFFGSANDNSTNSFNYLTSIQGLPLFGPYWSKYTILKNLINTQNISSYASTNAYNNLVPYNILAIIQPFADYKSVNYEYNFIKIESVSPLLFNSIKLYDGAKKEIQYKIKKQELNSITLEVDSPIFAYSFITNAQGTSPSVWIIKVSDGKVWENIHEKTYNLQNKKLYQTPIFYLHGTTEQEQQQQQEEQSQQQPQPQSFEKPEIDINKYIKYYKQKINPSINPEFKKYMFENNTYYFLIDEYDLNKNLVNTNVIVGFIMNSARIKQVVLYEDDDGVKAPIDMRKKEHKNFWDSTIGLALDFTSL